MFARPCPVVQAVFVATFACSLSLPAADEPVIQELRRENASLRGRVSALEAELKTIKEMLGVPAAVPLATATAQKTAKPMAPAMDFYGYIKADLSYDSAGVAAGNFAQWVASRAVDEEEQWSLTARQTRLGVRVAGPESEDLKVSGKVEADFYNAGGGENKSAPMLRHAYTEISWPDQGLVLLAGQTSDVFSPLVPSTLNYCVSWWGGDIGYRRPQFRLTKTWQGEESATDLSVAVSRTTGHDLPGAGAGDDTERPTLQGRVGYATTMGGRPFGVGVSGHWGTEEADVASGATENFETWSLNLDLKMPLWDGAMLQAEAFTGDNLDAYLGGIGQGVNGAAFQEQEISARGGWLELKQQLGNYAIGIGAAMDDPDGDDLSATMRARNAVIWGNVVYAMTDNLRLGLELSRWETHYVNQKDGRAIRLQTSVIYSF
jgi:hypothetical protein